MIPANNQVIRVMLVDDIKSHLGFAAFARRHPDYETIVRETENKIGMFGIAVNGSRPQADGRI